MKMYENKREYDENIWGYMRIRDEYTWEYIMRIHENTMRIQWEYNEIQVNTSEYNENKSETYEQRSIEWGIDEFVRVLRNGKNWVYMRWVAFYVRFFCSVVNQLKV